MAALHRVLPTTLCARCNLPLGTANSALLSFDDYKAVVHLDCLRCFYCNISLSPKGYVVRNGIIYCPPCSSVYAAICFDCGGPIEYGEEDAWTPIVAMGNLYHERCFICSVCEKRISGKFYVNEFKHVFCSDHSPGLQLQNNAASNPASGSVERKGEVLRKE